MKVINLCFFASSKNTSECVFVCGFMRVGIHTFKWINDDKVFVCVSDEINGSRFKFAECGGPITVNVCVYIG